MIATNVSYLAITGYNNIRQSLAPITTEGKYSLIVPVILECFSSPGGSRRLLG